MTPPLFLVDADALATDPVVVTGDEARHAIDVKRLRTGEVVLLSDGAGHLVDGVVATVARGRLTVNVTARRAVPMPAPRLVVVQALAKGGRDEDAVEAMTEIGVDEVVGWRAERSIATWSDRTAHRWTATARAAAKQSRRAWVPDINGPATTEDVCKRLADADLAVVLDENATDAFAALSPLPQGQIVVVVGPEGGITANELTAFANAGAVATRLGETVLRTSTAGVAALTLLCAATRWGSTTTS